MASASRARCLAEIAEPVATLEKTGTGYQSALECLIERHRVSRPASISFVFLRFCPGGKRA